MRQETHVLPVRCKGCNTMFDLWPILQDQEKASASVLTENHFAKLLRQSFCPDCKSAVLLSVFPENIDASGEDEENMEAEIEMMLELE